MITSRLDLVQATYNRALKDFRFTLDNEKGKTLLLHHAPDGFIDKQATIYARHKRFGAVLRKTSSNVLMFPKEGREFLELEYENDGVDAVTTLLVERKDYTTYEYVTYPFATKVDFGTYDIDEIFVMVQLVDSGFLSKIMSRITSKVDVLKRVSIGGVEMDEFPIDEFTIPDTSITNASELTLNTAGFVTDLTHTIPLQLTGGGDFSEAQAPSPTVANIGTHLGSFFNSSANPRLLTIPFDVQGSYIGLGGSETYEIEVFVRQINAAGGTVNQYGVGAQSEVSSVGSSFSFQKTLIITLNTGDSLCLIGIINHDDQKFIYSLSDVDINETYTGTPEKVNLGIMFYEFLLSLLQLTSDEENPLKSAYFGRTDSALTTYGSDGDGSLGFITRGIYFRLDSNVTGTIPSSFQEAFDSLSSVLRLGMGYEKIDEVDKMVVENLDFFFDSEVIVDLSDRLRSEDIPMKVLPERHFKTGTFGFGKYEYLKNAGLFEFNTQGVWTTALETIDNDLKKISKIRGDGQGMRLILQAPFHLDDNGENDYDETADVKGDDDLFMMNVVRDGGGFTVRTDEGFTTIVGSVYANASFNILYSPARSRNRWGSDLKATMIKKLGTTVRWQATDKNSTLGSQLATESDILFENSDVLVDDLPDTRYLLEEFEFDCFLTVAELTAIDATPNKLIKIADNEYGWINELRPSTLDLKVSVKLLRCNLAVVTPT